MELLHIPMLIYSVTAAMFIPTIHSFIFHKSCIHYSNETCSIDNPIANRNEEIHEKANLILLFSSSALCITGMLSSSIIGHIGDNVSRKLAMILPLIGLVISDATLIVQIVNLETSPYFFIVSEFIFGCFGGYMSIFSAAFSFISSKHTEKEARGKAIARLEGVIAVGGMIGYLLSTRLGSTFSYLTVVMFFLVSHVVTILIILMIGNVKNEKRKEKETLLPKTEEKGRMKTLFFVYALSYLAFIGTSRILFFYLKHQFSWDAQQYGYLRAGSQASSIIATVLFYPWLKAYHIQDVSLALFGLICRAASRLFYGLASSDMIYFGKAFSNLARVDAACNLVSSLFFHLLFPLSLSILPQASFYFMSLLIIPAVIVIVFNTKSLENVAE